MLPVESLHVVVVGQAASAVAFGSARPPARPGPCCGPFVSFTIGVGHEPQPVADMGRADARSRNTGRCKGVADSFQVSLNKVEPTESSRCRNLLAKDARRAALLDEEVPVRPKVPLVVKPATCASHAERLAGTRAGPHSAVVGPAGEAQGVRPNADAGEEVALSVAAKVVGSDVENAPRVDVAGGQVAGSDEVSQPLGDIEVDFVVVVHGRQVSKC